MGSGRIQLAVGAVKDQTSIGLAKVSNNSSMQAELEVAIVKATRHENRPAEERHIREILNLTRYSRQCIAACVSTISRRLSRTTNWVVALKTLILVHRILLEGDPIYEEEVFFATRRGTRLLNMSDFRDRSSTLGVWDYSAFIRTFARYLDERLDYKVQGHRDGETRRRRFQDDEVEEEDGVKKKASPAITHRGTPIRDMRTEKILNRTTHLQQMLERFLACRPTGKARNNPIVAVALYPLVKESHQIYYELTEIMAILVDRFMELEVTQCVKIHDIFSSLSKQFDELDAFYGWSRSVGIARSSDYPEVDRITQKKLQLMDEFIREKSMLASKKTKSIEVSVVNVEVEEKQEEVLEDYEMNAIKALPAPEVEVLEGVEEKEVEEEAEKPTTKEKEADLLNLDYDNPANYEEHANKLALAFFDNTTTTTGSWQAFTDDHSDWETALVESTNSLSIQKPTLGGGFDTLILDGMYQLQQPTQQQLIEGSASSVAYIPKDKATLALPAPPGASSVDPFAASTTVAPPSYVQMADMEKKQRYLIEEQVMWKHYATNGMQGANGIAKVTINNNGGIYQHQRQI